MSQDNLEIDFLVNNAQALRDLANMNRSLSQIERSSSTATRSWSSFVGNIGANMLSEVASTLRDATSSLMDFSDAAALTEGKLRLATDRFGSFAAAQRDVAAIARSSRSDIEGTADLYATITREAGSLGMKQAEVATATTAVAQSLKISGADAAASAGAIRQLSQALASGVLRGDEFNSVNEAAPRLMTLLADSMNIPKGQLRALAAEGKLTSSTLIKALTDPKLTQGLKDEFAKIPVTFADIETAAGNTAVVLAGAFSKGFGLGDSLAEALANVQNFAAQNEATFNQIGQTVRVVFNNIVSTVQSTAQVIGTVSGFISSNMSLIRGAVIGVATGFVIYRTALLASAIASSAFGQAVAFNTSIVMATGRAVGIGAAAQVAFTGATGLATAGFRAFTAALLANPLGLIAVAISAVVAAIVTLTDDTEAATQAALKHAAAQEAQAKSASELMNYEMNLATMTKKQQEEALKAAQASKALAQQRIIQANTALQAAQAELKLAESTAQKNYQQNMQNASMMSPEGAGASAWFFAKEAGKETAAAKKAVAEASAARAKAKAEFDQAQKLIAAAQAALDKPVTPLAPPVAPKEKKPKSKGMTDEERAAKKYADAVKDLNDQLRALGYTEEQQALSADLQRAGLSGDINEIGKKADEIRKLHGVIAEGEKQRTVTKVMQEYDQSIKEAGMSTEQLASVEGRRRAGLSMDLSIITAQTKAIDAKTLALYKLQQAQRVDDYVSRVDDDVQREKADQAAIRDPNNAEQIRLRAQYEERVRMIEASRELTAEDKKREIEAETVLYNAQLQTAEMRKQADVARGLSDFMVNLWENLKQAMKRFFQDLMKRLLEAILKAALLGEKLGGGGGIGKMLGGAVLGALGIGARATGGSVTKGKPYYINEKGKEMFIPGRSGEVINAQKTRQMMGGGGAFTFAPNYNIQLSGNAQQDNMTLAALKVQTAAHNKQIRQQQNIRGWQ